MTTSDDRPHQRALGRALALMEDPGVRSEIRRGGQVETEVYAYRHLSDGWATSDRYRIPLLRVAALAAEFDGIRRSERSLAAAAGHLETRKSLEEHVLLSTRFAFEMALPMWRRMLSQIQANTPGGGVNFFRMLDLAVAWDGENADEVRRRFLSDFYNS